MLSRVTSKKPLFNPKLESTHTHFPRDAFQSQVFVWNLNKASLPFCREKWGRKKIKRRNQILHVHRTIVKKPLVSNFSRGWGILSKLPSTLSPSFRVQKTPRIFRDQRKKQSNFFFQKRIITCGLDENYFPFVFCFYREISHERARYNWKKWIGKWSQSETIIKENSNFLSKKNGDDRDLKKKLSSF